MTPHPNMKQFEQMAKIICDFAHEQGCTFVGAFEFDDKVIPFMTCGRPEEGNTGNLATRLLRVASVVASTDKPDYENTLPFGDAGMKS